MTFPPRPLKTYIIVAIFIAFWEVNMLKVLFPLKFGTRSQKVLKLTEISEFHYDSRNFVISGLKTDFSAPPSGNLYYCCNILMILGRWICEKCDFNKFLVKLMECCEIYVMMRSGILCISGQNWLFRPPSENLHNHCNILLIW